MVMMMDRLANALRGSRGRMRPIPTTAIPSFTILSSTVVCHGSITHFIVMQRIRRATDESHTSLNGLCPKKSPSMRCAGAYSMRVKGLKKLRW